MDTRLRNVTLLGLGTALTGGFVWRRISRRRHAEPLRTVAHVDLERYMGRWFEIARYPAPFQRDCAKNTVAEYALRRGGTVAVENRCTTADGRIVCSKGSARIADTQTFAKLKVKFNPFMPAGDYWIIGLDQDYGWAVVGEPHRRFLWVLSRTPALDDATLAAIDQSLREQHYDPDRLRRTQQDGA